MDTLPAQYHTAARNMALKKGATRRPRGYYTKQVDKTTWKQAIMRKKSGTRPGPGNLTVDMLKAANQNFVISDCVKSSVFVSKSMSVGQSHGPLDMPPLLVRSRNLLV